VRDGGFHGQAIFLKAATGLSELLIDDGDRQATSMIGLDRIRQLKQFPLSGLGCRERAILLKFHLGSVMRRSPLGPRGILIYPSIIV
jgi:hypothetical protein